jgi:hypothetical protein
MVSSKYSLRNSIVGTILFAFIALPAFGQRTDFNIYDGGKIPRHLQASLIKRLSLFTEYQRTRQWDKVSEMLGPIYGEEHRTRYTEVQKQWMVEQLRSISMTGFTPNRVIFTTAVFGFPFSKRWWYIEGDGDYADGTTVVRRPAEVTAFRYQGEWYFSSREIVEYGSRPLLPPTSNTRLEQSGSQSENSIRYPNELRGYKLFETAKWKTLEPIVSTMADVRGMSMQMALAWCTQSSPARRHTATSVPTI